MLTISKDGLETLDTYDQGRIDTNQRFLKILEIGNRQTTTKEELMAFLFKELDLIEALPDGHEAFWEWPC